jgi:hypothetical protein
LSEDPLLREQLAASGVPFPAVHADFGVGAAGYFLLPDCRFLSFSIVMVCGSIALTPFTRSKR